jgi:hypothetical protein
MINVKSMDDTVRTTVYSLFGQAKQALERGNNSDAERLTDEAWAAVPAPKYGWDRTYMVLFMLTKLLRAVGSHGKGIQLVRGYLNSEYYSDHEDGPFFWLGTMHFEKGELAEAFEYLNRANSMSKGRCFDEEDPKYKAFVQAGGSVRM